MGRDELEEIKEVKREKRGDMFFYLLLLSGCRDAGIMEGVRWEEE